MQIWAEPEKAALPICNYSQTLYQFLTFTQNLKRSLKTTPGSDCALNALAIDKPLEYVRLYLDGNMQMWVDAEDSLELW